MRPIRVLIADDEPLIVKGLTKWLASGKRELHIVGEAFDGVELKSQLAQCSPDILISDICMPGFSGIDIIKELHQTGTSIKVIFISAYQEFDYVRDALQYGAIDYLVKPLDKSLFLNIMEKAIGMIAHETREAYGRQSLLHYEKKQQSEVMQELLERVTEGDYAAAQALERVGVGDDSAVFTVCLFELQPYVSSDRWQERENRLVQFAIMNVLHETAMSCGAFAFRKGERFALLLQHEDEKQVQQLTEKVRSQIQHTLKLTLSAGIGRSVAALHDICSSYSDSVAALEWGYFTGRDRMILHRHTVPQPEDRERLVHLQQQLAGELLLPFSTALERYELELFDTVLGMAEGNRSAAVSMLYSTVLQLELELKKAGIFTQGEEEGDHRLLQAFNGCLSYEALKSSVCQRIAQMREQVELAHGSKEQAQMFQVKRYIEHHYAENVTLETVAGLVYMNPYYFSTFFKKHKGVNFKTYLTDIRMKHAMDLLLHTDLMIYEIAYKVGYGNARHFSDLFKKHFGKLPNEYKHATRET